VTGAAGNQLGIAGVRQRHPGGLVDSEVIGLGPDAVRGRRVGELERLGLPETCNGTSHSGCSRLAATVTVGTGPFGVAVNDRTHTVYVVNNAFGDAPGTVSVINGATCNGTVTAGCGRHFPTMATGVAPQLAAVDAATGIIYVTDFGSAGVTILDGSRCNASVTSGCGAPLREQAVGSEPAGLAVSPQTSTVYVADTFQAGSLSVLATDLRPHAK
jgi:DNA-binding beta-propeller fold protein YncE